MRKSLMSYQNNPGILSPPEISSITASFSSAALLKASLAAAMIRSGLDDRIALHMIGRFIHNHQLIWTSHSGLRRALRMMNSELIVFLINRGIPQLSLKKVKKWLRI